MLDALRTGRFDHENEGILRENLKSRAIERIQQVRELWAGLRTTEHATFASYWAKGSVEEAFGTEPFNGCGDKLWQGIAPNRPLHEPIRSMEDMSVAIALRLQDLIDDTVNYVHWTLEWPKFVQIVRSVQQGTFDGDLIWKPNER
jgi:hypothetical protein